MEDYWIYPDDLVTYKLTAELLSDLKFAYDEEEEAWVLRAPWVDSDSNEIPDIIQSYLNDITENVSQDNRGV